MVRAGKFVADTWLSRCCTIQNIGAYGVEVAQFIESVAVMEANQIVHEMPAKECAFAYRDSIFKARLKSTANAPVILSVTFCLNRRLM